MSLEARNLAHQMNELDLSLESKPKDSKEWENGKIQYENILRRIDWVLPQGLKQVIDYLNENGNIVYNKFYKKKIEEEIKKGEKRK